MPLKTLIGFGLLPFWLGLAVVIYCFATMPADTAAVSLWIFVVAVPACAITLAMSAVAVAVYNGTEGGEKRKSHRANAVLVLGMLGLFAVWVYNALLKHVDMETLLSMMRSGS